MHFARMSSRRRRAGTPGAPSKGARRFNQRCAARLTYSPNKTPGQWTAHGRYIARESATQDDRGKGCGFDQHADSREIAPALGDWQQAGDPRMFKLIISPEFGDRLDLQALTRGVMARMEIDLDTHLEWIGTVHRNTEYPHVHVALRGVTRDGQPLHLAREYVKHGIRGIAEDLATAQLGYRTELDAQEAQRREIHQQRYTSLDRILKRASENSIDEPERESFVFQLSTRRSPIERHCLHARLLFLHTMGLAAPFDNDRWHIRSDFETVLRTMQRTADRQRALAAQSALLSDPRLPHRVTDITNVQKLAGRVLGHSEDESNGRSYMMLEGTDRQVHFIYHSSEIEKARRDSQLRPNAFVQFNIESANGRTKVAVQDLGSADALLKNKQYLRSSVRSLLRRGVIPTEAGLSGWLGMYEAALAQTAQELQSARFGKAGIATEREGGRR